MDLQAIEARLRANEAGRDGELYEHAPEDIRALLDEVTDLRMKLEAAQFQIEEVKALHAPEEYEDPNTYRTGWMCSHCYEEWGCWAEYPCSTMRALGVEE